MTQVHIINADLSLANQLAQLLSARRIETVVGVEPQSGINTLILSSAHEAAIGGNRVSVELARKSGAKSIVVVTENANDFHMQQELGGRLLRISVPAAPAGLMPLQNAGLLMLANIIGGQMSAMVAGDAATGRLIDLARRVARTDVTVFINGPTGSGKEVLSRLVHDASRRADKPFIAINCAAIPENMLEAILFGHEKGAFTGAATANKGLIRAADGGTLLLDEISEMPMGLQSKLLRVLQERSVTPIGAHTEVPVDIRIMATSNRDMPEEVKARRFREDLYYRLNVFPLSTQALAARPDDIPVLATALVQRHCLEGMTLPVITSEALSVLRSHSWPGNVRELENVIQRALVLCDGKTISTEDLVIDGRGLQMAELAIAV